MRLGRRNDLTPVHHARLAISPPVLTLAFAQANPFDGYVNDVGLDSASVSDAFDLGSSVVALSLPADAVQAGVIISHPQTHNR